MENASKALLMAGSILIAMLIIATGVYIFNGLRATSDSYYVRLSTQEVEKYNVEITKNFTTNNGQTYITAQGIVTLKNLLNSSEYEATTMTSLHWDSANNEQILQNGFTENGATYYQVNIVSRNNIGLIARNKHRDNKLLL